MVDALKRMDKKILIIVGIILLLPILIIIFLALIQGCGSSKITYEKYESKMISAAENYFEDTDNLPSKESETKTVKLSKLVSEGYIKSTEDLLGDDSCSGSVTVRRNGLIDEENDDSYLNYTVDLNCESHNTDTLNDSLMTQLTTEGSGLYNVNGEYIFKGEDVDNYLNFYGNEYRIMKIDKDGALKLIKTINEESDQYWDDKYNVETNDSYGKNIYKDSSILKQLVLNYNDDDYFSEEARKHMISYDLCIYSKDVNDFSIVNSPNCDSVLEDQVVSLIDINDFANASLDPDCTGLNSKSCRNYNYLNDLNLSTWTYVPVSNNTYEVYYFISGTLKTQKANRYNPYNLVIYIDGNETDFSGSGTQKEPYVIK